MTSGSNFTVQVSRATCGPSAFGTYQSAPLYSQTSSLNDDIASATGTTRCSGSTRCSMTFMSRSTSSPPLKAAIGVCRSSGSISMAMPRGGRPLVITKITPASCSLCTASTARSVSTLSCVTSVPSTSASSSLTVGVAISLPSAQESRLGVPVSIDDIPVARGDLVDSLSCRRFPCQVLPQCLLTQSTADDETVEAIHRGPDFHPLDDLLLVRSAAQHDAFHSVPALDLGLRHHLFARRRRIQALDLPDVRLHAATLQGRDRRHHQVGAQLPVVGSLVPAEPVKLVLRGRHQKLEHELAVPFVQPVAEPGQPLRLARIERRVALRVVPHKDLAEGRVERLDVGAEVVAVLELELLQAGLLDRHCQRDALGLRAPGDTRAELLVHQHAADIPRCVLRQRPHVRLKDDLLDLDDAVAHLCRDRCRGSEQVVLEGTTMVKRHQVERLVVAECHLRLEEVASRKSESGRCQWYGSMISSTAGGPHDPCGYVWTGGGLVRSGSESSHSRRIPSDEVNRAWSPSIASRMSRS